MCSFIRMFRGTFHMMFCRLNWSSQATVMAPTMPSFRPAVWSVRRAPPKKNEIGIMSSPHLDAGDRHRPVLPRGLETRDRVAARLQRGIVALRVARVPDHRDDRGGLVERVEHRVVVFVQLVEFRLLDLDRRADAGVAAFRVADLRLEALDREDDVADALEALDLPVHRHLVPDGLEVPADALQLIRELDAEQVVRGADVLSPPVAGVAGDHQLDLLEQSSVLFNAVADIGHGRFSPSASPYVLPGYVFRGMDGSPGAFRVHHKEHDGRSPSITLPDDPSMTMNICFPLCAYSMNHTGAWSNSPSYVVGYTWIDSRLSTRVFACFSANLWASAAAWDFASASVTSPLCTSTPPVWRLSKFILFCSWNWNPSSGWYFTYPRTATIGMLYCIWMRSRTRITCGCVLTG